MTTNKLDLDNPIIKFFAAVGVLTLALPFLLAVGILSTLWRAWWLYPAWSWFIVPLGAPVITFWHFTALTMLLSLYTRSVSYKKEETDWSWLWASFLLAPLAWALLKWMR